jgi:hypothetical protein
VSGKEKQKDPETCWSEAEIPSEAKRQRGTLNPETLRCGAWSLGFYRLHHAIIPSLQLTIASGDSNGHQ